MTKELAVELKLKKKHPKNEMRLGKHIVGMESKTFLLDEEEQKELAGEGPQFWFAVSEEKKVKKEK
jgi:hypothetical protein